MTSPHGPQGPRAPRGPQAPQGPLGPPPPAPPPRGYVPPQYPQQGYPPHGYPPQGYAQPAYRQPGGPPYGYGHPAPNGGGVAVPRPVVRHSSHPKVIAFLAVALLVAAGAFVLISKVLTPSPKTATDCPPSCGAPPPVGPAVAARPRFTASDGSWSVEYPQSSSVFTSFKKSSDQFYAELANGAAGIVVRGAGAGGRTPQQIVQSYLSGHFPDARPAYEIGHAQVGYTPGYGAVYDTFPQSTSGTSAHYRLVLLAAVKNDTYVLVVGFGSYRVFEPGNPSPHASGAATGVALFMDPIINSVLWKGDPAR